MKAQAVRMHTEGLGGKVINSKRKLNFIQVNLHETN